MNSRAQQIEKLRREERWECADTDTLDRICVELQITTARLEQIVAVLRKNGLVVARKSRGAAKVEACRS